MYITSLYNNNINLDVKTYMEALQISQRGPNVILKQNPQALFINACNNDILFSWRGNVDVQYIINEIATVKYVCSYMTKGKNRSIGPELMTAKTGPIHLSLFVEIAFVD